MRILEVSRYKEQYIENMLPFVLEQGESLRAIGCEVDYFTVKGNYLFAVKDLKQKIRFFKPDIVHAHYGLSAITAELQTLVPVVTTFHNGETLNGCVNWLTSLFSLRAKHVVYVAEHIRDKAYFVNKHNTILPCGVNLEESKPTQYLEAREQLGFEPEKKYILFGGAFSNTRKNVALIYNALDLIGKKSIHGNSWTISNNSHYQSIEVLEMKGLDRRTVALYMSACDLFALPSKSEGSPQALKEAMACGCPCLATDIADVRKLLGELDGNYISSFNPDDVANGIAQLLALSEGFRTQGRERIMQLGYTNEIVAQKLVEIYEGILS